MPVFNKYIYKPLSTKDAIRLVVLDPTTDKTAPPTCRIIEQRTSATDPDYAAVSYVWGNYELSQTLEIRCDGDVAYLRITPNVDILLRGLRWPDKPRRLWIDVICLNQNDEMEKAQQIPSMGNIYRKAVVVEIWLGPENPMTATLLAFFQELSRLPDVTKWKTQWEMAGRIVSLMIKFFYGSTFEALNAIYHFFQQPWFSHRWIIQEACLPAMLLFIAEGNLCLCRCLVWLPHVFSVWTCRITGSEWRQI